MSTLNAYHLSLRNYDPLFLATGPTTTDKLSMRPDHLGALWNHAPQG
jgi:hypothetical protein